MNASLRKIRNIKLLLVNLYSQTKVHAAASCYNKYW